MATHDAEGTVWVLARSRSTFFTKARMPTQCFWRYLFEATGQPELVTDPRNAPVMDWNPDASNCPDLQDSVGWVVSRLPPGQAHSAAGQVFAGRVLDGHVNARSWTWSQAAGIDIPLQFTNVIVAYLDAFRSFLRALREGTAVLMHPGQGLMSRDQKLTALENGLIRDVWESLEQARDSWRDMSRLAPVHVTATGSEPTTTADWEELVAYVERFSVAHELAHLLLGHHPSRAADHALQLAVSEVIIECGFDLDAVTSDQREELEADGFAFLVCSGAMLAELDFVSIYRAELTGFVALLAAAHVNDTMVEIHPETVTHPDFMVRQKLLSALVYRVSAADPPGPGGQHPVALLIQMEAFITVALQGQLNRMGSPAYSAPSLRHLVRNVYERIAAFERSFEADDPATAASRAQAATRERISELLPTMSRAASEPEPATADHWAVNILDQALNHPADICPHLRSGHLQAIFLSAWEAVLRCEACWTQHGLAEKIRDATGRPPLSGSEDHTCDQCGKVVPGQLVPIVARIGVWVLTTGLCPDCQQAVL